MTHPSPRALERLVADDLPPSESEAAESHVATCDECAAKMRVLRQAQATLMEAVPPEQFVMRVAARKARSRRRVWLVAPAGLAAAAALALLIHPHGDLRTKGRTLSVRVQRGDKTWELGAYDGVAGGDRLQLSLAGTGEAGVWVVDATGRIDRLTDAPLTLSPSSRSLSQSTVIESPCVDSKIVVMSGTPSDAELRAPPGEALVRTLKCR